VRDHGVIRLWALEMVKPIGILTPKRARKMLKKGRAVQIVMQSLVKLNSLYEFLKQLERVSADSLMELWSDNSKKLIALLQRITQSMVNMFVHLVRTTFMNNFHERLVLTEANEVILQLLITSKAEIENIFVKGYHKTPKRFHKAVDAVAIYLISQFEVLRKFTATTCFDMIMIPFWKSTVSVSSNKNAIFWLIFLIRSTFST
jgi:predicted transcriptional regulator